jgi:hypothetical protein
MVSRLYRGALKVSLRIVCPLRVSATQLNTPFTGWNPTSPVRHTSSAWSGTGFVASSRKSTWAFLRTLPFVGNIEACRRFFLIGPRRISHFLNWVLGGSGNRSHSVPDHTVSKHSS